MRVMRGFPDRDIVACFDETPGGGNIEDITAPCNAPALNPAANLSRVYWHSDFFQFEGALPIQTVTINHTLLAGKTLYYGCSASGGLVNGSTSPPSGNQIVFVGRGDNRQTTIPLLVHGLGYVPVCYVAYNGRVVVGGQIIQLEVGGQTRLISVYATASEIGLVETAYSNASDLPAVSRTFQLLVCRTPVANPARTLFGLEGSNVILGRGKIDSSKRYLRKVGVGETPFSLDLGPTVDTRGGRLRIVVGGQTTTETGYTGSFTGSSSVQVGL